MSAYQQGRDAAKANQNCPTSGSYADRKAAETGYWDEKTGK